MSQRDEFRGGELERGRESNTGRERDADRDERDSYPPQQQRSRPVTNEWEAARGYASGEGRHDSNYGWDAGASQPNYGTRGGPRGYWREPYRDQAPYRQDFRTRYREMPSRGGFPRDQYGREHSSEQLFDREPFSRHDELGYYGTGSPGRGDAGPGFTGGAHGYDDGSRYPRHSLEGEYSDESAMSYENQSRRDYGHTAAARYPRGPKGYQRSDERLKEDISERLMEAYHIDSSEVTVEVRGAKVSLEGTVPSRHMKHAIEDMVDRCPGVLDIDNRIRVAGLNYQGSAPTPSQSQSQSQSSPTTLSPSTKSKQ